METQSHDNEMNDNETDTNKNNDCEIISISSDDVSIESFDAETVEQMEEKKKLGMTIEKINHWEKFAFEEDQLKKNVKEMLQREFQVQINFLNETRLALKKERNKIVSVLRQPNIRVRLKQKKIDKRDFWDAKLVKNQIKITNMEWDMQQKPLFHKYDAITAIRKSKDTYYALIKRNGKFC